MCATAKPSAVIVWVYSMHEFIACIGAASVQGLKSANEMSELGR